MTRARALASALALALVGGGVWWRRHPSACPYSQRIFVQVPRPLITRKRLLRLLEPGAGERLLEVGPGTGYFSLDVAGALEGGTLEIFDIQQEMLDHVMRRAGREGRTNIVPRRGDARELPYGDQIFDGAYLVTVLGEIPDQNAALRELTRVLRPGGRLIVGEIFLDVHMVTFDSLVERATRAGLRLERRLGGRLAFFARFERDR